MLLSRKDATSPFLCACREEAQRPVPKQQGSALRGGLRSQRTWGMSDQGYAPSTQARGSGLGRRKRLLALQSAPGLWEQLLLWSPLSPEPLAAWLAGKASVESLACEKGNDSVALGQPVLGSQLCH